MITLALDRYDRHFPLFDGTVGPPTEFDLEVLQVGEATALRDGTHRHAGMLRDGAYDAAETSLASYVAAKARGEAFTAIPVFPRRLFSAGQIFVNADAGIRTPADLNGRTIGLQSFQTTLAVLAKGDLAADHGVDLRSIRWRTAGRDIVDVGAGGFDIEPLPPGSGLPRLLADGAIDALFFSRTPRGEPGRIRRLFDDPRAEEARYVATHGYWPIMHVVALTEDVAAQHPGLPAALLAMFEDATRLALDYAEDPNWSRLAWAKYALEDEERAIGRSLWTAGLAANRANLDRFIGYALDQGLIDRRLDAAELFHPSVRAT